LTVDSSCAEPPTVAIKVRTLTAQVVEIKRLFRPSDSLLTLLTQFLHEYPLETSGGGGSGPPSSSGRPAAGPPPPATLLQLVVPTDRKTYSYSDMRSVTLSGANLVPRATIVLQVKKK
jgi:hypothetical protein